MIFFDTQGQAALFRMLLFSGMGSALLYDLFAILRRRIPFLPVWIPDIIWCLLSGFLCIFSLAWGGEDTFRGFALPGMLLGAGIYGLGIRRVIRWGWRKAKQAFKFRNTESGIENHET